jgi:uncharacterized damage-inducible protein DinB
MSQTVVKALHSNFKNTFGLMRDTIGNFDDENWRKEYTWFMVPVRVAYHNIECVDFYFRDLQEPFTWGYRFGRSYWETPNDEQPTQAELLAYLDELEGRVAACFGAMQDEELGEIYDETAEIPQTKASHYTYALRHTVHHQGSLAALADILGVESADWDKHAD